VNQYTLSPAEIIVSDNTLLQGWQLMAGAYPNPTHQHLSAAAMFVLEVTRIDPHWAEWSETDVSAIRSPSAFQPN